MTFEMRKDLFRIIVELRCAKHTKTTPSAPINLSPLEGPPLATRNVDEFIKKRIRDFNPVTTMNRTPSGSQPVDRSKEN